MGVPEEALSSTVRFSFCKENTEEDVDDTLASLKRQLPMLRRFVRK
jgi:cysteine sulfinate desulfinase/cysteine desulfurase-like protein